MATKAKKEDEEYNNLKEFAGSRYSGMKVGASHKWYYDQGEWRERKVTPEEWDIYYETTKRRAGKAPEGSGAPVGTEYNWLIVAHQRVDKLDANSYRTCMEGKKFKVAHKRAAKNEWNTTEKKQRKKVIRFLEQVIEDLKAADEKTAVPYTVGKQQRIYGLEHRNKNELYEMAAEMNLPNRSKMNREGLLNAIKANLNRRNKQDHQEKELESQKLTYKTKDELYELARGKNIKVQAEMKKKELVELLEERMVF